MGPFLVSETVDSISQFTSKARKPKELARMGGSLFFKAEVPGSSFLSHLPKEFSFRLT